MSISSLYYEPRFSNGAEKRTSHLRARTRAGAGSSTFALARSLPRGALKRREAMWLIDEEHAVPCCSDDCLSLMVVPRVDDVSRVGYLELLPKFRYNVRVSGMSLSSFREVSARLLFSHNVLLVAGHRSRSEEDPTEAAEVSSVVLVNLSPRILRIAHGGSDVSGCEPARWDGGASGKRGCWGAGAPALWGMGCAGSNGGATRGEARDFAQASHWKKHQAAVIRKEVQEDFPLSDASERSSDSPVLEGG